MYDSSFTTQHSNKWDHFVILALSTNTTPNLQKFTSGLLKLVFALHLYQPSQ